MGWLLHCDTDSLRMHKPCVPCSLSLSNNYVIIKSFSRNITDSTNLAFSKKFNQQVPVRLSFQGLPLFFGEQKLAKCIYVATRYCFIHSAKIFSTLSLIYQYNILSFVFVCLAKVCKHSVITNVMKDSIFIVRVILRTWSVKILILSSLRH